MTFEIPQPLINNNKLRRMSPANYTDHYKQTIYKNGPIKNNPKMSFANTTLTLAYFLITHHQNETLCYSNNHFLKLIYYFR
jgi:hypothetical protein